MFCGATNRFDARVTAVRAIQPFHDALNHVCSNDGIFVPTCCVRLIYLSEYISTESMRRSMTVSIDVGARPPAGDTVHICTSRTLIWIVRSSSSLCALQSA